LGDVDTVDTGETSRYTQDGGTTKAFAEVVRTYVYVLKHCTIVTPGTFCSTVWRNYVLNCLGKCLLKRIL